MQASRFFVAFTLLAGALAVPIPSPVTSPSDVVLSVGHSSLSSLGTPSQTSTFQLVTSIHDASIAAVDNSYLHNSNANTDTVTRQRILTYISSFETSLRNNDILSMSTLYATLRAEVSRIIARYIQVRNKAAQAGFIPPTMGDLAGEMAIETSMVELEHHLTSHQGKEMFNDLDRVEEQVRWLLDDHVMLERLLHPVNPGSSSSISPSLFATAKLLPTVNLSAKVRASAKVSASAGLSVSRTGYSTARPITSPSTARYKTRPTIPTKAAVVSGSARGTVHASVRASASIRVPKQMPPLRTQRPIALDT